MSRRVTELHPAILAKRDSGWSSPRIAKWLATRHGETISDRQVRNIIAAARAEQRSKPTRKRAKGERATVEEKPAPTARQAIPETLAQLRKDARRIRRFASGPLQLRALELESRILEREVRAIEAADGGGETEFIRSVSDLMLLVGEQDDELHRRDPKTWAEQQLGRMARDVYRLARIADQRPAWLREVLAREYFAGEFGESISNAMGRIVAAIAEPAAPAERHVS